MSWLKRLSLSSTKAEKQSASSASAACAKLSRRSWPFLKSPTEQSEVEEEESAPLEGRIQRVSVIRPPIGGGEYKGALPAGQSSPASKGARKLEDSLNEDLLIQVFLHLSLEVYPSLCWISMPWPHHLSLDQVTCSS